MPLQSTVNEIQPIGVEAEMMQDVPHIVDAFSGVAEGSLLGRAYTLNATTGIAQQGGTGTYLGIAVLPKEQANYDGALRPNLALGAGATVGIASKGRVIVVANQAVDFGDNVHFVPASGALQVTGGTAIAGAKWITKAAAGELAVVQLW